MVLQQSVLYHTSRWSDGVAIVIVYTFVVSMLLYWLTNRMIQMRVSPPCEEAGLDISQHDEVYNASSLPPAR